MKVWFVSCGPRAGHRGEWWPQTCRVRRRDAPTGGQRGHIVCGRTEITLWCYPLTWADLGSLVHSLPSAALSILPTQTFSGVSCSIPAVLTHWSLEDFVLGLFVSYRFCSIDSICSCGFSYHPQATVCSLHFHPRVILHTLSANIQQPICPRNLTTSTLLYPQQVLEASVC